jgi:hypothetical protein
MLSKVTSASAESEQPVAKQSDEVLKIAV